MEMNCHFCVSLGNCEQEITDDIFRLFIAVVERENKSLRMQFMLTVHGAADEGPNCKLERAVTTPDDVAEVWTNALGLVRLAKQEAGISGTVKIDCQLPTAIEV